MDLKLRRCLPYFNLSVLEQSEDNMTSDSDRTFLLSMLMQKADSRGNIGLCMILRKYTLVNSFQSSKEPKSMTPFD